MSTPCEIQLFASNKKRVDTIAQKILIETKRLEKKYNYYSADSILAHINNRTSCLLDNETIYLLQQAKNFYIKTHQVFDITIATIKDIFRKATSLEELHTMRAKLLPYIGCEHFKIVKKRVVFDNPYTKIDLGGLVKEYAVDRAARIVKQSSIKSALINFGGDMYAVGKKPNGKPFRIGIKNPDTPTTISTSVAIENEALATSASYERFYTIEKERFSHIIATNTHTSSYKSVTVIAPSCMESGVYATALMIDDTIQVPYKVITL